MAYRNKTIHNPKTKQDITFLQTAQDTDGQLLEMEAVYNAHSNEPAAHYHPCQTEDFTVLSGELTVRLNGKLQILKKGESLHIPQNSVHAMWNDSTVKTIVHWKVCPAMKTEYFLETATGLAADGKTNGRGMPRMLQVAMMANKFEKEFRISKPSFGIQKLLFALLLPVGFVLGYRPVYKKYLD